MKMPAGEGYARLLRLVNEQKLHTVCQSAKCPNMGECWAAGTATLMILGDVCTRSCGFCHIATGKPQALKPGKNSQIPEELRPRIEDEVGDLFFVLVNIARYLSVDPESALRKTNRKFRRRFGWLEQQLHNRGKKPEQASLEEMETLWQQAKSVEET